MQNYNYIIKSLRLDGKRITKPRAEIIHFLAKGGHFSVEDIINHLKKTFGEVNVATVYNNIRFLVREGIIVENNLKKNAAVYELKSSSHFHIICQYCNKVEEDVEVPELTSFLKLLEERTNFVIKDSSIVFRGICSDCRQKDN